MGKDFKSKSNLDALLRAGEEARRKKDKDLQEAVVKKELSREKAKILKKGSRPSLRYKLPSKKATGIGTEALYKVKGNRLAKEIVEEASKKTLGKALAKGVAKTVPLLGVLSEISDVPETGPEKGSKSYDLEQGALGVEMEGYDFSKKGSNTLTKEGVSAVNSIVNPSEETALMSREMLSKFAPKSENIGKQLVQQAKTENTDAAVNIASDPKVKEVQTKQIINNPDLDDKQKEELVNWVNNPKMQRKTAAKVIEGKPSQGPMDSFKEAMLYFAPKILGLVGGVVTGDVEAGLAAGEEGMKQAGIWRSYEKEKEEKEMAKQKLAMEAAEKQGVADRAWENINIQKQQIQDRRTYREAQLKIENKKLTQSIENANKKAGEAVWEPADKGRSKWRVRKPDGTWDTRPLMRMKGTNTFSFDGKTPVDINTIGDFEQDRQTLAQNLRQETFDWRRAEADELTAKDVANLETSSAAYATLNRIDSLINKMGDKKFRSLVGPADARLERAKQYTPGGKDPVFVELDTLMSTDLVKNIRETSGTAFSAQELATMERIRLSPTMDETTIRTNLKLLKDIAKKARARYIKFSKLQGKDVPDLDGFTIRDDSGTVLGNNYNTNEKTSSENVKEVNGAKYKKVKGGWQKVK